MSNAPATSEWTNFYETFYNSFLTTANSLPINSMWLVSIDRIPDLSSATGAAKQNENWATDIFAVGQTAQAARTPWQNFKAMKGIILAQGVKNVGDSFEINRKGNKNTGHLQGLVGEGRSGLGNLNISFLENNVSFVDYVLRPWVIEVAYKSLKNQTLKTNITITFLSKIGPREQVQQRKAITYYNCCPISIDTEEYNYSGADVYKLRQVEFVYSHYSYDKASDLLLDLISPAGTIQGMFGRIGSQLTSNIRQQFGANNLDQYVSNLTSRAATFGQNLLAGTLQNIVSNVTGGVQERIDNAITSVTGQLASAVNRSVGNINEFTQRTLDDIGGVNRNADTPTFVPVPENTSITTANVDTPIATPPRQQNQPLPKTVTKISKISQLQDTPSFKVQKEINQPTKPTTIDANKTTNQNDVVESSKITYIVAKQQTPANVNEDTFMLGNGLKSFKNLANPSLDVRNGQINHQDVEQKIAANDVVQSKNIIFVVKTIDPNDTPSKIPFQEIPTKTNDAPRSP